MTRWSFLDRNKPARLAAHHPLRRTDETGRAGDIPPRRLRFGSRHAEPTFTRARVENERSGNSAPAQATRSRSRGRHGVGSYARRSTGRLPLEPVFAVSPIPCAGRHGPPPVSPGAATTRHVSHSTATSLPSVFPRFPPSRQASTPDDEKRPIPAKPRDKRRSRVAARGMRAQKSRPSRERAGGL